MDLLDDDVLCQCIFSARGHAFYISKASSSFVLVSNFYRYVRLYKAFVIPYEKFLLLSSFSDSLDFLLSLRQDFVSK